MFLEKALLLRSCCLVLLCVFCATSRAQDPPLEEVDAAITTAVNRLSSRRFEIRQQAFESLVAEGSRVIAAVEAAVLAASDRRDLDHADRCVEILAGIAREKESRESALLALDRLAADEKLIGSRLAKRKAFDLRETKEDRAARMLTAAGVRVQRSSRDNSVRYVSGLTRNRQFAYLQYLPSLSSVSCSGLGVTDKCFAHLAKVPELQSVSIMRCAVSNRGLAELSKLERLSRVSLAGESFGAEGLKHLGKIANLSSIAMFTPIGVSELQVLSEIPVQSLYLSDLEMSAGVSDVLAQLGGRIRSLHVTIKGATNEDLRWVEQTKVASISLAVEESPLVTDDGLMHLQDNRLRSLRLNKTGVTPQCLAEIAKMEWLSSLSIYDTSITDKDLMNLTKLSQLRSLSLRNTKVSDEGVAALRKSLPNLRYARHN